MIMTDSQDPNPEERDLAEGEEIIVDALTGEVTTLSAEEVAAEEAAEQAAEQAASAVAVADVPEGISPELIYDPFGEEPLSTSKAEFESLLSQFSSDFQEFREGEIVKARVLSLTDTAVILEFGFKSEGSVALDEFKEAPEVGSEVEVLLESLEDDDGVVVLSKKKADFLRVWEKIREAHDADRPVKGTLVRKIKGGVTVDLMGVDAFLPGSQIALRRVPNIEDLIGEVYKFKIIKLNKRRRNIVVSRRVILEAERQTEARDAGQGAPGRAGARRPGQEHHRLRCVHRPGRTGRPAPHHRHVLGPRRASVRDGRHRCSDRRQGPRHRLEPRTHLAGTQATSAVSVDRHRQEVPGRLARSRQGRVDHQLRRVHRVGEGRRRVGAHLGDVVDAQRQASLESRLDR